MTEKTLKDFYRSPKLYVQLPTGGKFYKEDTIDWPETNELPVYAMTPKDELTIRNPDALLNGDAVLRLIKSCVPDIKIPENIVAPDMELLLVAIRAASEKDRKFTVNENCPECDAENSFDLDLSVAVQDFEDIGARSDFNLSNGLKVTIKPANYLYSIQTAKQMLEQANLLGKITNEEYTHENERLSNIGKAFEKMAQYNYAVLVNSIDSISIPDSDVVVTDYEEILQFIDNVEAKIGKELDEAVSSVNNGGINKIHKTACPECDHEYEIPVDFDPVSFFLTS